MAGLQRSAISFRRQGSSGLVWDDKLVSGELNPEDEKSGEIISSSDQKDNNNQKAELRRTKSDGGGRRSTYRTVKVEQAEDPPSPRLSACGFCSVFTKSSSARRPTSTDKRKSGKRNKGR